MPQLFRAAYSMAFSGGTGGSGNLAMRTEGGHTSQHPTPSLREHQYQRNLLNEIKHVNNHEVERGDNTQRYMQRKAAPPKSNNMARDEWSCTLRQLLVNRLLFLCWVAS
jgi:hypothetical protein